MLLIKNGILHFADAPPKEGLDILVEGKRIARIGSGLSAGDAKVIDAAGKHVLPGFVLPVTSVGITDYANLRVGDSNESPSPVNAGVHVRHALDVREVALQGYRRSGVTAFGCAPGRSALVAGQMGVYHTAGRRVSEMCIKETAALKANFTVQVKRTFNARSAAPMTRMGMAALLRGAFLEAKNYKPEKDGPDENKAVLCQVLRGELPLLINVETGAEIETVLDIAQEFGIQLILHGGYAIGEVAQLVLDAKTPLLLGDLQGEGYTAAYDMDLPGLLALREKGLALGLSNSGDGAAGHECLLWDAVRLVQEGLDAEEALRLLSIENARILGVDDEIGSLAEGKYADIAVYTAHPMQSWQAAVDAFVVAGELIEAEEVAPCC